MIAIDIKGVAEKLCHCTGVRLQPKLTYTLTEKTLTVQDETRYATGDNLNIVILHVYDVNGKVVSGFIKDLEATVDISKLKVSDNLSVLATVVSEKGDNATVGIYNIGLPRDKGVIEYLHQGNEEKAPEPPKPKPPRAVNVNVNKQSTSKQKN